MALQGLPGANFNSTWESSITLNTPDTIKFIHLYQKQQLLWNVNLPHNTNKAMRTECLNLISTLMGKNWTEQQVKDKILSLRSRYSKELVKVRVAISSGMTDYKPVWRFFPLLDKFLRPFCSTRKIDSPTAIAFQKRLLETQNQTPDSQSQSLPDGSDVRFQNGPQSTLPSINAFYGSDCSHNGMDDFDDVQIIEDFVQPDTLYIDDSEVEREESSDSGKTVDGEGHSRNIQRVTGNWKDPGGKHGPEEKGSGYTQMHTKQEKMSNPPSPPAPPLPCRKPEMTANVSRSCAAVENIVSDSIRQSSADANSCHDGDSIEEYTDYQEVSSVSVTKGPAAKKVRLESQSPTFVDSETFDLAGTMSAETNGGGSSLAGSSSPLDFMTDVSAVKTAQNSEKHLPNQSAQCSAEVKNEINAAESGVKDTVSSQMATVLQTLVSTLADKTLTGVTQDTEIAFANYVVCELRSLDQDLRADVKYSVQKAIYDAQKEMRLRKTVAGNDDDTADASAL